MSPENPQHDLAELTALMNELHLKAAAFPGLVEENLQLSRRVQELEHQISILETALQLSRARDERGYE